MMNYIIEKNYEGATYDLITFKGDTDIYMSIYHFVRNDGAFVGISFADGTPETEGIKDIQLHDCPKAPYGAEEIAEVIARDPEYVKETLMKYQYIPDSQYAEQAAEGVCGYYWYSLSDALANLKADDTFECWEVDDTPARQAHIASLLK